MPKKSFSTDIKILALQYLEEDRYTLEEICTMFSVNMTTLQVWRALYKYGGVEALIRPKKNKVYTEELKQRAVKDYLLKKYSMFDIIAKYGISGLSVFKKWLKIYTSHSELYDSGKGMSQAMTKGRKTTVEERIEIAKNCLANGKNYQETATQYEVSYQQVYLWVRKFEQNGEEALQDQRGRTKPAEKRTPEDEFRLKIQQMERENERLRAENLPVKKVRGNRKEASLSRIRIQGRYMAIQELAKNEKFSIVLLCKIAKVSRAAYYKWLNRQPTVHELENEQLVESIQHLYTQVEGIYGYRRITMTINRQREKEGLKKVNKKRIYRLMQICSLEAVIRRRPKKYRKVKPDYVAENVLAREFTAEKPNQKWCTDVTEFKYGNGKKAYLSAIIDLYDKSIVSYVLGHSNNNDLVFKTIRPAIRQLSKDEFPLLHSDRGYQYTSKEFKRIMEKAELSQSMSRVGRCIDNGPIEAFWGTLKVEKYYLHKFESFEALKCAIDTYITFYNHERYQERLNGLSPLEYRAQAA
ncbi:IS3 family transposase [Solibacillus sp. MA9]|uniref:IS3 family transposase n=1 Tax=Solibacillus palustris TaxID=2908203 RepID=A0ABS9UI87_9BACL|nr:IS3 family transposase [Solibacillus sp. MA9]MCH7324064.1 IS3 family transposase [Solibacillus sp. MA9]